MSDAESSMKHLHYSREEIAEYIMKLKEAVNKGSYSISRNENRKENDDFIKDYRITTEKEVEILNSLGTEDFCYAVNNRNPQFSHEMLYVFCKEYRLDRWGTSENVEIYIKTNLLFTRKGDLIIVISFHRRNMPITYLFR